MVDRLGNQQMRQTNRDAEFKSDLPKGISLQTMQLKSLSCPVRQFGESVRDAQQFLPRTGFRFWRDRTFAHTFKQSQRVGKQTLLLQIADRGALEVQTKVADNPVKIRERLVNRVVRIP